MEWAVLVLILGFIGMLMEYWKGFMVLLPVIVCIYLAKTGKMNSLKERKNSILLSGGRYVFGRDIDSGIYDIYVLKGKGSVKVNRPVEIYQYLDSEKENDYKNLEISQGAILEIGTGMRLRLSNKREYREIDRIEENFAQQEDSEFEMANQGINLPLDTEYMDGWQFENFCADVLKNNGYKNVEVTKGSGDQGVDVLAERDGIKYAIQCKHYSQAVGNKAVQEIFAGKQFYHCHVGIVMTNNYFTPSAKENGIILWDGEYLSRFLKGHDDCECVQDIGSYNLEQEQEFTELERRSVDEKRVEKREEKKKIMYDREKGIYPPGVYVVGEDIEIGKYILNAKNGDGKDPLITFYENYSKYRKDETSQCERFDDEYYVSLRENGMVISVRDADIQRL